jgi:pimeloyl-ACP methyl ester carboxylesterase
MSAVPPQRERSMIARPDKDGVPTFDWTLTSSSITDVVKLIAGPFDVLPVVFVPGIMGSNLKTDKGKPLWRLDTTLGEPVGLLRSFGNMGAGLRQSLLHPDRCVVDADGAVPGDPVGTVHSSATYKERGWGSVGQGSYHPFLLWLEEQLNPFVRNPARWTEYYQDQATVGPVPQPGAEPKLFPGIRMGLQGQPFGAQKQPFASVMTDDLLARVKFMCPVYATGYNWLASNRIAALELQRRLLQIIAENNKGQYRCEQVILVTHSMGGLVARACAQLSGMADRIAGVVHGVMPAAGAAVAYRRCKVGMRDESAAAGLVIGSTGQEVTAVFAQAPGALQLLPSQRYAANWLRVIGPDGNTAESLPAAAEGGNDPYSSIYRRRDRWWGLVNEAWLAPRDGQPIRWEIYDTNVDQAEAFHTELAGKYHANTYVYYGADSNQKSFEKVTWRMRPGLAPDRSPRPNVASVLNMSPSQVRMDGTSPEHVGGKTEVSSYATPMGGGVTMYDTSYWELHCEMQDGVGDGTVPVSSGAAPLGQDSGSIQQQFKLSGFDHEASFKNLTAQRATLYAINKIVGKAKRPQ